jgi:hypothetical protein
VLYEAAQKPHSERPPVLSTYPCIAEAMERLGGPSVWLCLTEAALNLENGGDVAEVLDVMHGGFPHSVETVANGDPESTVGHFIFALRMRLRNETIAAQTLALAAENGISPGDAFDLVLSEKIMGDEAKSPEELRAKATVFQAHADELKAYLDSRREGADGLGEAI